MSNTDAAGRAAKETGAGVNIIKKTSSEYALEKDKPPCPSVMVDGSFVVKNDSVTFEALKDAIKSLG